MDDIVKQALAKWPNVPHCTGWLLLDRRGGWRMRADAAQAAGARGSNLGPLNPALKDQVKSRLDALKAAGTDLSQPVPVDLVTASASGLDPEISPAAADYQGARGARARKMADADVRRLVADHTSGRQFGVLGEPRVNVLKLNLALDAAQAAH